MGIKNSTTNLKKAKKRPSKKSFLNGEDGDDVGVFEGVKPENYSDRWALDLIGGDFQQKSPLDSRRSAILGIKNSTANLKKAKKKTFKEVFFKWWRR